MLAHHGHVAVDQVPGNGHQVSLQLVGTLHDAAKIIALNGRPDMDIAELHQPETFETCLQAANTGHLVLSTVHSENATNIIDRAVNMFDTHRQNLIRILLAETLLLSIGQRLVPRKDGGKLKSLDIYGIVRGSLDSYSIELGKGRDPSGWKDICESSTAPLDHGLMCSIEGKRLRWGDEWTLRIKAKDGAGKKYLAHLPFSLD